MTIKKIATASLKTRSAAVRQPSLYHRLETLLHTMRFIAQYEDALCELAHELKGARSTDSSTTNSRAERGKINVRASRCT